MYITPYQVLQLTPRPVRKRSVQGRVTILKDTKEKPTSRSQCRSIYMRVSLRNTDSSHLYHSCAIKIYGSSKDAKQYLMRPNSRMWVHCHCPYFLFYCEEALWRVKATDLIDCDPSLRVSDPKRQRNPRLIPYVCKHLYAAITSLLQAEKNQTGFKPFINKQNPYTRDYKDKIQPSYRR